MDFFLDAIPEIIAGLTVTAILAVIGRFYSLRSHKKGGKKRFPQNAHPSTENYSNKNISPNILPPDKEQDELSNEEIILPVGANIDELREMIVSNLRDLQNIIARMGTRALNWRPLPGINSIFVLATHITGTAEEWICHYVGNMPIERNRDAEFVAEANSPGWAQELKEHIGEVIKKIEIVFDNLKEGDLNKTIVLQGKAKGVCTILYCLVHVVEHTNSHLAEIRMIKDLSDFRRSTKA